MAHWKNISNITRLKIAISVIALVAITLRVLFPSLKIDAITLGMLLVAVLPWLSALLESAKFPGGWEIKFRDLQEAAQQVTSDSKATDPQNEVTDHTEVFQPQNDPNLALVGLRIEIERRVKELAIHHEIQKSHSLKRMLNQLQQLEVLDHQAIGGLSEIIMAGNPAAHGAHVEPSVATWAIEYGSDVIAVLDKHINEALSTKRTL